MDIELLKDQIYNNIGAKRVQLGEILQRLHDNPEIGGEEFQSVALLTEILGGAGFELDKGVASIDTAFVGTFCVSEYDEPKVAYVLEYDALPSIGHACGHNASAAASIGACLALAEIMREHDLPGTCMAVGTPGEENKGFKVPMIEANIFKDVCAAMMVHAYDQWILDCKTMALDTLEFTFKGKPAHAAVAPHEGINALDAVMLTFHGINCLRQHIIESSRIHGIVTHGGVAPNIVPEEAVAKYYVRATTRSYLEELNVKVRNCARGAAIATGCELEMGTFEHRMDNMNSNVVLLDTFAANLARWVEKSEIIKKPEGLGSTDMGNLSQAVPSIHPLMPIAPKGIHVHTHEFTKATLTDEALDTVIISAAAMACTGLDLILDKEKRDAVMHQHNH